MDDNTQQDLSIMPESIEEVENLILDLYRPGLPQTITRIQEKLQRLQRSAEGWQLASTLLESDDEKVQFFGALTFTVKLNSDSEALTENDAKALLYHLLNSLIRCLQQDIPAGSTLVARKLCSTLVVFFLQFPALWTHCVRHLIYSLVSAKATPIDSVIDVTDLVTLAHQLPVGKAPAALWFCTSLAEEVGKTDATNAKHHKFHEIMKRNTDEVVALIGRGLTNDLSGDSTQIRFRQDAMKCFQAWVLYSHRAFIDASIVLDPLKSLTKRAISCIVQDELYEVTIELFSDILSNYSRFLSDEDIQLLFTLFNSQWSQERYEQLVQGDFSFESLQYGQFMIAFGDATVQDLVRSTDLKSQQFLTALAGLLAADGYAIADDHIFVPALEFWSTFVEVMVDSLYSDDVGVHSNTLSFGGGIQLTGIAQESPKPWLDTAQTYVTLAIERCWRKIRFPQPSIFDAWDSVDKSGFADARKDVADLLQSSYTLTGTQIFSMFANLSIQSLGLGAWQELEASLFCLGALAECMSDDTVTDSILSSVFGSTLLNVLANDSVRIPERTKQTTLLLIGQYDDYFQRHVEYLPDALDFLFKALRTPSLSITASKSIISLSSSCRQSLTSALPTYFQHYAIYLERGKTDCLVKERVVGAIAAIVQALSEEEAKCSPLAQLLQLVEYDCDQCRLLTMHGNAEEAEDHALEALRCLASMAKGLQVPSEIPVDLEDTTGAELRDIFWINGNGSVIQHRIQTIMETVMSMVPESGEIVEAACSVFRAGFTEKLPGPFVFSLTSVTNFIVNATVSTPRLGDVITTACAFVSSQGMSPPETTEGSLHKLLIWLLVILQTLQGPATDTEIAQTGIDFVYRLLPNRVNILNEVPRSLTEHFFMFTLRALAGNDPLPKFAAAEFWSQFVSLTDLAHTVQKWVDELMEHLGPLLAEALVHNIIGNALRSELDKVSDPLKKLVVRQVRAKAWLESSLLGKSAENIKVNEADRRIFLQKIISLRGAKQTNLVVREFWLAARGSNFSYAS